MKAARLQGIDFMCEDQRDVDADSGWARPGSDADGCAAHIFSDHSLDRVIDPVWLVSPSS